MLFRSSPTRSLVLKTHPSPASLKNYDALQYIVTKCQSSLGTAVAILSIIDGDQQLFLAATGLPEGVDVLPRSASFCQHMILNGDRGLVITDSSQDWRFAKHNPTDVLGARFYAGKSSPSILSR